MSSNERAWAQEAISLVRSASEKGLNMMIIRKQDTNDEADMVITNVTGQDIAHMGQALLLYGPDSDEA